MKKEDVDLFEKINAQLVAIYEEITALSKKSPDGVINEFKLKFINRVLQDANTFLDDKHKPFPDFTVFEEDILPSNSDAVFIISQYLKCMDVLKIDNIDYFNGKWYWILDGKRASNITDPPKKLK